MDWLFAQVSLLLGWVSDLFARADALADDLWSWVNELIGRINIAVFRAVQEAYVLAQGWVSSLFATFQWVSDVVEDTAVWLWDQAKSNLDLLRNWIDENIAFIGGELTRLWDAVRRGAGDVVDTVIATVRDWVEDRLNEVVGFIREKIDELQAVLDLLSSGDFFDTINAMGRLIGDIVLWFSDPLRALRDLVVPLLVGWVCRALAHEIDESIPLFGKE